MSDARRLRLRLLVTLITVSVVSGCLSDEKPGGSDLAAADGGATTNSANSGPTITGSPDTAVLAGDVYSFTPSASDPDGDSLVFSIQGKPTWLSFDSATGTLSGQALLGDVGTYNGIRISVSDGTVSRSLPDFSITVAQVGLGSMSLSWTAPTENSDGSALTDLAGYNLYYGESQGNYNKSIRIDNPSISTYLVENLLPDTYYVVATSFNTAGIESTFSNVAVKTVSSE